MVHKAISMHVTSKKFVTPSHLSKLKDTAVTFISLSGVNTLT